MGGVARDARRSPGIRGASSARGASLISPGAPQAAVSPGFLARWQARINGDPALARVGRHFSVELAFEVGDAVYAISVERGRIASLEPGSSPTRHADLRLRAAPAAWARFVEPVPPPRYQSVFALVKRGEASIDGDWSLLMRNLLAFTSMLEAMRHV